MFRYGAPGSVAVGALVGVNAKSLGTATGPDGRIWVMWGDTTSSPEIAYTRSNRAGTRFEPIQTIPTHAFSLTRITGDGRLGPLDLFVDERRVNAPSNNIYYIRVLPELTATITAKPLKGTTGHFKVRVSVTDAGDPVPGATVSAKGKSKKTSASGRATLLLLSPAGTTATVTVKDPGYKLLSRTLKL